VCATKAQLVRSPKCHRRNASHPMDSSRVTMSDISQHPGSPGLTALFVPSQRGDRQASALRELPACSTTALDLDANQPHRRWSSLWATGTEIEVQHGSYNKPAGSCNLPLLPLGDSSKSRIQMQLRSQCSTQSAEVGFEISTVLQSRALPRAYNGLREASPSVSIS
jgi:hypothetical protein